jgi:hypothetical protein
MEQIEEPWAELWCEIRVGSVRIPLARGVACKTSIDTVDHIVSGIKMATDKGAKRVTVQVRPTGARSDSGPDEILELDISEDVSEYPDKVAEAQKQLGQALLSRGTPPALDVRVWFTNDGKRVADPKPLAHVRIGGGAGSAKASRELSTQRIAQCGERNPEHIYPTRHDASQGGRENGLDLCTACFPLLST